MNEFKAAWEKDWIGAVHLPTNQTFGFIIEEGADGGMRLIGGVVVGTYDGRFDTTLHDRAMAFARDEVSKKYGKPVGQ